MFICAKQGNADIRFDREIIGKLMRLLNDIVDTGNSMIIIEHDTDVLKNCDYLIELGPGGGTAGGRIIATGTVKEIKKNQDSVISEYL